MKQSENVEPMPTLFFSTNNDHKCDQLGANDVKLISNNVTILGVSVNWPQTLARKGQEWKKTYISATTCFE